MILAMSRQNSIIFFMFKWLCWMVTLLQSVGLERITPECIYISVYARTNRCYKERASRTNYVRSSIPHCTSIQNIYQ
jgi:hypothetical protein